VDVIARPECISLVSELTKTFLRMAAGLDEKSEPFSHLRIAIVEMVTNVVRHGYRNGEPGPLSLELTATPGWVTVRLRDRGVPFDSTRKSALPAPEALAEGGYGLGLVQSMMDELEYAHRPDTGNLLTMRKRIGALVGNGGETR
jgi:anti-sigma regulatory factor (Ser/Thr protein kinase)